MNPLDFSDFGEAAVRGLRDGVRDLLGADPPRDWTRQDEVILVVLALLLLVKGKALR